ncbi:MAG: hypothetical protein WDN29_03715 [Methylovirgula sp.]
MPLRLLLVRSIALIFLATLALSTLLVFWRAYEKVEADMTASLAPRSGPSPTSPTKPTASPNRAGVSNIS